MTFRASLALCSVLLGLSTVACSGAADPNVNDGVPSLGGNGTSAAASNGESSGNESATANGSSASSAANGGTNSGSGLNAGARPNAGSGDDSSGSDADAGASTTSDAAAPSAPIAVDGGGCPALTYPSGVKLQTFPDAATTASYKNHLASGEAAPTCFLDANNLVDPDTGTVYPLTVNVSANFQLAELVGTEIDQGYGHYVLAVPAAVAALEKFRENVGESVDVISGFRSPKHQEDTCKSLCGNPLGCSGTCANNSRHMHGDAFDLPTTFYTSADQTLACTDGFKFSYLESGTHLHVDQNPAYSTCVKE